MFLRLRAPRAGRRAGSLLEFHLTLPRGMEGPPAALLFMLLELHLVNPRGKPVHRVAPVGMQ